MTRIIKLALSCLIIQIGLTALIYSSSRQTSQAQPNTTLLQFVPASIDSIELSERSTHITLRKSGNGWIIDDDRALPADSQLIEAFLQKLASLKQGFAVATTAAATSRFFTAEDNAQHHLILKEGSTRQADLFIGSAAGFKKAHARKNGSNEIFALELSSFELAANTDKWLDKHLLKIDEKEVTAVRFPNFSLEKTGETWQLAGLSPNQKSNDNEVRNILSKITDLAVEGIADQEGAKKLFDQAKPFSFSIQLTDGNNREFSFVKDKEKNYVGKISGREQYFRFFINTIDDLQGYKKEKFLAGIQETSKDGKKEDKKPSR